MLGTVLCLPDRRRNKAAAMGRARPRAEFSTCQMPYHAGGDGLCLGRNERPFRTRRGLRALPFVPLIFGRFWRVEFHLARYRFAGFVYGTRKRKGAEAHRVARAVLHVWDTGRAWSCNHNLFGLNLVFRWSYERGYGARLWGAVNSALKSKASSGPASVRARAMPNFG